jgi:ribonuclease P protein component
MLSGKNRLKRSVEFDKVYKKGRIFGTKYITFRFLENNLALTRVGFVIGTKIDKRSTVRNLLKRRMREVIRLNLDKIKPGFDIVLLAKPGAAKMEYGEIERDIFFALKKAGLL